MANPSNPPLETSLQRTEHTYVRLWVLALGALCLLVAICWGGRRAYMRWQERKLMRQAHVAYDRNDLRWAAMAAQRAFAVDPESVDACRTLADIAQRQKSVEAIDWRRRAVTLEPDSLGDRLALAEAALRFDQPAIAAEAIASVPAGEQENAAYQSTAAHVALKKNDPASAEKYFQGAVRLAPNEPGKSLELAEFQLHSEDREKRAQGRELARRLKDNPAVRLPARHVLINDALRWRYDSTAIELARELEALPEAPLSDRLLVLDILRRFRDPAFTNALSQIESESTASAEKAVALLNWLNGHGLALVGLDWSKKLPAEMLNAVPMRFALASAEMQLSDWPALRALLERGTWGRAESLRLALEARVAYETGDNNNFEKSWVNAVAQAENDPERLNILQTVAFQWHWPEKATAVLWMLAGIPTAQREALQTLYRYYAGQRDTSGLYRTLARLVAVMPDEAAVRNNFAQLSLLLDRERPRAVEIARTLHEERPRDAAFASTYAFALHKSGDTQGALRIMSQLTPDQLQEPSVAAYYGILLSAAGRTEDAANYLGLAETAKLLPEEEELVARARAAIARQ